MPHPTTTIIRSLTFSTYIEERSETLGITIRSSIERYEQGPQVIPSGNISIHSRSGFPISTPPCQPLEMFHRSSNTSGHQLRSRRRRLHSLQIIEEAQILLQRSSNASMLCSIIRGIEYPSLARNHTKVGLATYIVAPAETSSELCIRACSSQSVEACQYSVTKPPWALDALDLL